MALILSRDRSPAADDWWPGLARRMSLALLSFIVFASQSTSGRQVVLPARRKVSHFETQSATPRRGMAAILGIDR